MAYFGVKACSMNTMHKCTMKCLSYDGYIKLQSRVVLAKHILCAVVSSQNLHLSFLLLRIVVDLQAHQIVKSIESPN